MPTRQGSRLGAALALAAFGCANPAPSAPQEPAAGVAAAEPAHDAEAATPAPQAQEPQAAQEPAQTPPLPAAPQGERWANAFAAYPGSEPLCRSEADHGSSRSYVEVHGSSDARRTVLAFYDQRHGAAGKSGRYSVSDASRRAVLSVYTRQEAEKQRSCSGAKLDKPTVIVVESEVRGEPERFDGDF